MKIKLDKQILDNRQPEYSIHPAILNRYSPRVFKDEKVTADELNIILEAAKWAPSSSNIQPWRFIVAPAGTKGFEKAFSCLHDFNQNWTKKASFLITIISALNDDKGLPNIHHSFDTGAAWENMAIQASDMDLVAHAMGGFDREAIKEKLNIPDDFQVECVVAIGKRTPLEEVPEEFKKGETPKGRKNLSEIVIKEEF